MKLLILLPIILPIVAAFIVFAFKDEQRKQKNIVVISLLALTFLITVLNCFVKNEVLLLFKLTPQICIELYVSKLSKLFSVLFSFVFSLVTIYTFEYIKHEGNENRFYVFFFTTLSMLIALAYSNNIITMYLFFEMVSLLSMPLVLHSRSKESIKAAKKYLFYSVGGAFLALFGIFYIVSIYGNVTFGSGVVHVSIENKTLFCISVLCMIIGFATKAGMFPLHGWLPSAHPVAPSPASAVLSGVITKAGVIAIIRIVYYVIPFHLIRGTFVQYTWLGLATFTVFMGSLLALLEKNFKKRLAYSSVSQLSYILVGLAIGETYAIIGALVHVVAHMLIKVTLFLFAGEAIYKHHYTKVDEFRGIGVKMPVSTWVYTIASLGLIGIPLTAGFISKWYLATGIVSSNVTVFNYLIPAVLLISAILTAGYLLPITINGFFVKDEKYERKECSKLMVVPMMVLALLILVVGIFYQPLIEFISKI